MNSNSAPEVTPARDQPGRSAALLIIDMINPFDFDGGEAVRRSAQATALTIARLREAADRSDVPTIYVNDNFGQWHSEKSKLIDHVSPGLANGAVDPRDQDYFVIKPQFSGFYSTNLAVLLPKLGVRRLILTGIATEICVLFTAADAHMRDYDLWIPDDAVVAIDQAQGDAALGIMRNTMGAETSGTAQLSLSSWLGKT
jgi:nicotinamidase-related amidase